MKSLVNKAILPLAPYKGKKVYVGLSGGVDSAVTAALLQKAGAEVTGVFIKGWYPEGMPCSWRQDRRDAMRVAARLRIPFITLDASAQYKEGVIDYLLREYEAGRTPNPDSMCNREVKFGVFYTFAMAEGADAIATGHYAQAKEEDGRATLYAGVDGTKDQSYFLWAISLEALAHTVFPLGALEKSDTRILAKELALPVAEKHDSQGICFLGSISVEEFLKRELGAHPGEAKDVDGKTVGTHAGALLYTAGQRVALTNAPPGPWYVLSKEVKKNELVVSPVREAGQTRGAIVLSEVNMFAIPSKDEEIEAQYRYHGTRVRGHFDFTRASFTPTHAIPESIAPGQSLVLYRGAQCLGGGIIKE